MTYQFLVDLGGKLHSFEKIPKTLTELKTNVSRAFPDKLPAEWDLKYLDSDDELCILSIENEYQTLLQEDEEHYEDKRKLYVIHRESGQRQRQSQALEEKPNNISMSQSIPDLRKRNDPQEDFDDAGKDCSNIVSSNTEKSELQIESYSYNYMCLIT